MKIFQIVQQRYATLGISPSQQSPQKQSFNGRIFFGFFLFAYLILSQVVYIFEMDAGSMGYMECVCSFSGSILIIVGFAAIVLRKDLLFKTIDNMEQLFDTSKDSLSEIIFMIVMNIALQSYVIPIFIISFGVYFITDSGSDAFQLPFPMW